MTESRGIALTAPQSREEQILSAAFEAFAAYGFRKTSMDDIARLAGMSRSALYLSYANKEDILQRLARTILEDSLQHMKRVLDADDGSPQEVLLAAFVAKDGRFVEAILNKPHARELVEDGLAATSQIVAEAESRISGLLAGWLARQGVPASIGTPEEVATSMVSALHGLKATGTDFTSYREGQRRLAKIFALALASNG